MSISDGKASSYVRPNQRWVCGHAKNGCPCAQGPDGKGRCRTTHACEPRAYKDGYRCNRSNSLGGACEQGPLPDGTCCLEAIPCKPSRSVRAKRGLITACSVAGVVAALGLILAIPTLRNRVVSPGPLSSHHAGANTQFVDGSAVKQQDCAACHAAAHQGASGWLSAALDPDKMAVQNDQCLNCHGMDPHNADHPHGVDPTFLASLRGDHNDSTAAPLAMKMARMTGGVRGQEKIACATCHKEHHGADFDITRITDQQCQVCHQEAFVSFAHGHPEFSTSLNGKDVTWPYLQRTSLAFDHAQHFGRFQEALKNGEAVPHLCTDCHQPSQDRSEMHLASFEQACATCHHHTNQIEGAPVDPGVNFLQLPGMDTKSLADAGLDISPWPADRRKGGDGVTPFMALLMNAAPAYPTADYTWPGDKTTLEADLATLKSLQRGSRDLRNATEPQKQAAQRVALAVKQLLNDLADQQGTEVLKERLEASLGRPLGHEEFSGLIAQLPLDLLKQARDTWFPSGTAN